MDQKIIIKSWKSVIEANTLICKMKEKKIIYAAILETNLHSNIDRFSYIKLAGKHMIGLK